MCNEYVSLLKKLLSEWKTFIACSVGGLKIGIIHGNLPTSDSRSDFMTPACHQLPTVRSIVECNDNGICVWFVSWIWPNIALIVGIFVLKSGLRFSFWAQDQEWGKGNFTTIAQLLSLPLSSLKRFLLHTIIVSCTTMIAHCICMVPWYCYCTIRIIPSFSLCTGLLPHRVKGRWLLPEH